MQGTLIEVIDRLDEFDDTDPYAPLEVYAEGGPDAEPTARSIICPGDSAGSKVCTQDSGLRYVLTLGLAKDAIEAWSAWRSGRIPGPQDKLAAVMYYSRHDADLPVDEDA